MIRLPEILPEPGRPPGLPREARWLAGEGAGSWFVISQGQDGSSFEVTRYSPEGIPECKGIFKPEGRIPQLDKPYDITYPSHCRTVTLLQGGSMIRLSTF